jgi:hypothetical protein
VSRYAMWLKLGCCRKSHLLDAAAGFSAGYKAEVVVREASLEIQSCSAAASCPAWAPETLSTLEGYRVEWRWQEYGRE